MADWIDVGPADRFPDGAQVCTKANDQPVVVFNLAGELRAILNICPHAGLPLGEGERRGKVITCPFHGYTYHLDTGKNIDYPDIEPPVRTFPVRVVDSRVQVDIQKPT